MEALSRREEEEIEAAAKTEALKLCDDVVGGEWDLGTFGPSEPADSAAFAACAHGRTFTTPFACREPFKAMNACIKVQ